MLKRAKGFQGMGWQQARLDRIGTRILWLLGIGFTAGCGAYVDDTESTDEVREPVQRAYTIFSDTSTLNWVNLLFADSRSQTGRTVAAAISFELNPNSPTGFTGHSCGATFISPRFAITGAHCMNGMNSISIRHYDTTALSANTATSQSVVTGTWPNWTRQTQMTSSNGYKFTTFNCVPVAGCNESIMFDKWQIHRFGCPFSQDVDLAMFRCDGRKTNANYAQYYATLPGEGNPGTRQVETWWFHEILFLATQPGGGQPGPTDSWEHYGMYSADPNLNPLSINYHYTHAIVQNFLLPVRSSTWPNGTPYRQIQHETGNIETRMDTPICHGTSGSGVMDRGTSGLFGIVSNFANFQ